MHRNQVTFTKTLNSRLFNTKYIRLIDKCDTRIYYEKIKKELAKLEKDSWRFICLAY